ncbi:hypothetical protein DFS33DRAFT_1342941 [Desarmillaria ectypa]|nr:hypothetical protein DFS33DRAFT_1342941 [Desarmillaria ectypa]
MRKLKYRSQVPCLLVYLHSQSVPILCGFLVSSVSGVHRFLISRIRSIFKEHYYIKASKARKSTNTLFGAENFVGTIPPKEGISVYMATVDPHLLSCDISIDVDKTSLAELERVQRSLIRRLLGIVKRSSVAMLFSETLAFRSYLSVCRVTVRRE